MLDDHAEAIEADLLRYYGVDLARDLGTERLTYRRLRVLLEALPRESAYVRAVAGPAAQWGPLEHLVATVVDSLTMLNHNTVQMRSKKKLPRPQFLTRPGVVVAAKKAHGRRRPSLDETREFWTKRRRKAVD